MLINKNTLIKAIISLLIFNGVTTSLAFTDNTNTFNTSSTLDEPKERCNYQIDMYTTAKAGLNLRKSPKISNKNKILIIPFGTKVTTLTPIVDDWVKIVIHDETDPSRWETGYVFAKYLSKKDPTAKTLGKYKVTTNTLNMRSKAGTSSKIIGKLKNGDRFDIIKSEKVIFSNNHYFRKVKITQSKNPSNIGKTGWIAVKYTNAPKK